MSKEKAIKMLRVANMSKKWTIMKEKIISDYMECHLQTKLLLQIKMKKQSSKMIFQKKDTE